MNDFLKKKKKKKSCICCNVVLKISWKLVLISAQVQEMCKNSSTAVETRFLSLPMLQQLEGMQFSPGMPIFLFFSGKNKRLRVISV